MWHGLAYVPLRARYGLVGQALVDVEDLGLVSAFRWYVTAEGYVLGAAGPSWPNVYMHRVILGLERGDPRHVDHRNGLPFDNRRANLRVLDAADHRRLPRRRRPRAPFREWYPGRR